MDIRFYENQGFTRVADFLVEKDDRKWPGVFFRMEIEKREEAVS